MSIYQDVHIELFLNQDDEFCKDKLPLWVEMDLRFIKNHDTIVLKCTILNQHLQQDKGLQSRRKVAESQFLLRHLLDI